jgi:hypothetical protein
MSKNFIRANEDVNKKMKTDELYTISRRTGPGPSPRDV